MTSNHVLTALALLGNLPELEYISFVTLGPLERQKPYYVCAPEVTSNHVLTPLALLGNLPQTQLYLVCHSKVSLSLRKKSRHRHVGLQVWELITKSQFDDWRHIIHHWKRNSHSYEMIFPQIQKSRYAPAKYELFYCSFVKPKQRYLVDFGPRYHNKKGNL